ncbi:MAG: EamA family transporter [Alphaproteobacteria bacterium]
MPSFTTSGWLAVLFIGFASSLGYYTWLLALKYTTPTRVALFLALGPIVVTGLGAIVLDETISPIILGGLVSVVAGLLLARLPARHG